MNIIVSIHDKHLEKIKNGTKTSEVRKNIPKSRITVKASNKVVTKKRENEGVFLYWYNTKTKMIEGVSQFVYAKYVPNTKDDLHKVDIANFATQLTFEELKEYIGEKRKGFYLWDLGDYKSIEPYKLPEGKIPPQSWCYKDTIMPKPMFEKE